MEIKRVMRKYLREELERKKKEILSCWRDKRKGELSLVMTR